MVPNVKDINRFKKVVETENHGRWANEDVEHVVARVDFAGRNVFLICNKPILASRQNASKTS